MLFRSRVLEIGAGYCDWINQVRAAGRVAVDIWPEVARYAGSGVSAKVLDISRDLPTLGRAAFDIVLASNVIEHFEPEAAALLVRDIATVLAPGGRLLIVGHHPADHESGARRPHGPGLMFSADDVLGLLGEVEGFDTWTVEVAEEPQRVQETPEGPLPVTDTVVRVRRPF